MTWMSCTPVIFSIYPCWVRSAQFKHAVAMLESLSKPSEKGLISYIKRSAAKLKAMQMVHMVLKSNVIM